MNRPLLPILGYGFRPFFLGAGLAALLIPWWAGAVAWGWPLGTAWPPTLWHGHEMLFGFIAAAIAGFLLTAVPSWTGERGFAGWPLLLLATLWVLGRVAIATSSLWPMPVVAALDLLFLPALATFVLPPLIRARNRNVMLLVVLTTLWATDIAFYRGVFDADAALARRALLVGIDIVLLLITVIGGRIIPAFTSAVLKQKGVSNAAPAWRALTPLAVGAMLAVTVIDLWRPDSAAAGVAAAATAVIQLVRLARWQGIRTLRAPILWVLHLGYLWLPLGFALKAIALLTGLAFAAFYLHALTIGAAATMILAVMTRASLGHTGRFLVVSRPTAWAYGFLTAAAAVRVFGPAVLPLAYPSVVVLAAALWTIAFGLFLRVYAPILTSPRADGKPG
ncbi:MAG TPA: NnrS family protein [Steroidobacteraceae bacterium]|nr:NnrS family protein [Steroidobacteraceae bacterium]